MALPMRRPGSRPVPAQPRRDDPFFDPFYGIDEFFDRVNRSLRTAFSPWGWNFTDIGGADIEETEDAYLVEIELPGVKAEDVTVEIRENQLWIHGEIREREQRGTVHRQVRRFGRFDHRVSLPAGVDPERVEATLADGLLTVRLGKSEGGQSRRVVVKPG